MTITNKKLIEITHAANSYISMAAGKENKLTHALNKFAKLNQSAIDTYNESVADYQIDYASLDEKKNLIRINREYVYTPENQKKLNAAIRGLYNLEIEVTPVSPLISGKDIPENMAFKEVFAGLIIDIEEPIAVAAKEKSSEVGSTPI